MVENRVKLANEMSLPKQLYGKHARDQYRAVDWCCHAQYAAASNRLIFDFR
jgi:hypothetical protein